MILYRTEIQRPEKRGQERVISYFIKSNSYEELNDFDKYIYEKLGSGYSAAVEPEETEDGFEIIFDLYESKIDKFLKEFGSYYLKAKIKAL